jgi:uncharacterized protein involved in exopolysaccharide biosynthesis
MSEELYLKELIAGLWRRRILILTVFLVTVISTAIYTFTAQPVYQVVGEIALGNFPDKNLTSQFEAKEILLSNNLTGRVKSQPDFAQGNFWYNLKVDPVKDNAGISGDNRTSLLMITLQTNDSVRGVKFVDELMKAFIETGAPSYEKQKDLLAGSLEKLQARTNTIEKDIEQTRAVLDSIENTPGSGSEKDYRLSKTLETLQSEEKQRLDLMRVYIETQKDLDSLKNTEIIKSPQEPVKPIKPRISFNMIIAAFFGLTLGVFLAFAANFFTRDHKTRKE